MHIDGSATFHRTRKCHVRNRLKLKSIPLVLFIKLLVDIEHLCVCSLLYVLPWLWVSLPKESMSASTF